MEKNDPPSPTAWRKSEEATVGHAEPPPSRNQSHSQLGGALGGRRPLPAGGRGRRLQEEGGRREEGQEEGRGKKRREERGGRRK